MEEITKEAAINAANEIISLFGHVAWMDDDEYRNMNEYAGILLEYLEHSERSYEK